MGNLTVKQLELLRAVKRDTNSTIEELANLLVDANVLEHRAYARIYSRIKTLEKKGLVQANHSFWRSATTYFTTDAGDKLLRELTDD